MPRLKLTDHNREAQISNFLFQAKLEVFELQIKMTSSLKQ